jgi:hypothetical protein
MYVEDGPLRFMNWSVRKFPARTKCVVLGTQAVQQNKARSREDRLDQHQDNCGEQCFTPWHSQPAVRKASKFSAEMAPTELYGLYAFVQPTDVENACTEWIRRPGVEGETCRSLGRETINGRSAVKY